MSEEVPEEPLVPEEENDTVGVAPTGGDVSEGEEPTPTPVTPTPEPEPTAPPGTPTETVGEPWNP